MVSNKVNKLLTLSTFFLFFLAVLVFSSCRKSVPTCNSNKGYHKIYNTKKNRSNYGTIYGSKGRSVKKDYVIKNGIAR